MSREWQTNANDVQEALGPEVLVVRDAHAAHKVEGLILKDERGREVSVRCIGHRLEVKVDAPL